jgi:hypothetical protein
MTHAHRHLVHSQPYQFNPSTPIAYALAKIRSSIWFVGVPSCLFGVTDRSFAAFADGYVSAIELVHLFTASFFFLSWLCLKPEALPDARDERGGLAMLRLYQATVTPEALEQLAATQARMRALQPHHLISQAYILPLPYLCQVYHLLNLKHLESVHSVSLNNLRILGVSQTQPTHAGGRVTFQTVLDSPVNVLRIWRPPVVEVDLTLHGPYTVELSIPVYGDKRITVMFNALPLTESEHQFLIDIHGDLQWFKPVLQLLLHLASCLTLFEDLPYLNAIARRPLPRLLRTGRQATQDTMWLYKRFVDLYGESLEAAPARPLLQAQSSAAQFLEAEVVPVSE